MPISQVYEGNQLSRHKDSKNMSKRAILLGMKSRGTTIALAIVAMALATFSTCELPPSFGPEYYDTSTNLIAARPFAPPPPASDSGTGIPLGSSAVWDWAWRGQMGNDYEYMTLGASAELGPGGTGDVWRLEMVNLFRNGTFEEAVLPGDITVSSIAASGIVQPSSGSPTHRNALRIESDGSNQEVGFFMPNLLADPVDDNHDYLIRFVLAPVQSFPFTAGSRSSTAIPDNSGSVFMTDPMSGFGSGGFSFGPGIFGFEVDEVRVIRGDQQAFMYYRLFLKPEDTIPSLPTGYYEFSVWVKKPDDSLSYNDANRNANLGSANAPYAASQVTLGIRQWESNSGLGGGSETFLIPQTWTRLSYRLSGSSNIEIFDETTNNPVIELYITIGDNEVIDAGALLISNPSLNIHINN